MTARAQRWIAVRKRYVALAAVALAIGGFVVVYRGPGRAVLRGSVGDVAATLFVFALLSLVWRARARWRALTTFAIALSIELAQLVQHRAASGEDLRSLTIGSHFDWWDLVAYAAGIAIAVAADTLGHGRADVRVRLPRAADEG